MVVVIANIAVNFILFPHAIFIVIANSIAISTVLCHVLVFAIVTFIVLYIVIFIAIANVTLSLVFIIPIIIIYKTSLED